MALTEAEVKTYYQAILQREPTDAQLAVAMATGTADSLISALIDSNESQSFVFPLIQVYQAVFGRVPDAAGLDFWVDAYRAGTSLETITEGFVASEEFQNKYGNVADGSDPAFIQQLYINVLGRAGEPAGVAFWTSQTGISPAEVVRLFATDAEFTNKAAGPIADFLTDAANGVENTGSLFPEGTRGLDFVLTTGVDVLTGTVDNDTFHALIDGANTTLSVSDVINGGDGTDTLSLTVAGAAAGSLPAADITNVENFLIRDVNTGGASAYDFSLVAGEQQVWAERSVQDVDFQNLGNGTVVGVRGNGNVTNGDVQFNMATATSAVSIALDGGLVGAPNITATAGSATSATISSTGAANTTGTIDLSAGTTITSLTVNADSNLTAVLANDYAAAGADLVVSGTAGRVNLGANGTFRSIDASGLTNGGLTITTDTVTRSVIGGGGNDVVTLAGLTATGTVNLGAGNDTLLGSVVPAAGASIDGGAGTDTVASALINAGNGGKFLNFEVLALNSVGALDLNLLTGSSIESLQLVTGGGTYQNVQLDQSLSVTTSTAGITTLAFTGATGAADSYAVSFDANTNGTVLAPAAVNAGTLVLNGVENIAIDSGSAAGVTANSVVLSGTHAETVTITGDQALNLSFAAGFGSNADGAEVTTIDGSAATGALSINVANVTADAAGLTVIGGSAADTLTAANFAVTFTGGAGGDTFNVNAALGDTNIVTITDFSAGDSIDFSTLAVAGSFNSTAIDVSTAVTLAAALDLADNNAGDITWFQYAGNTYVVAADATVADNTGDNVVQLTGLVDLSSATDAAGVLTFG